MSSGVVFLEFMAVMDVVGDGISPSMAQSVQLHQPLKVSSTWKMENLKICTVYVTSKESARKSTRVLFA